MKLGTGVTNDFINRGASENVTNEKLNAATHLLGACLAALGGGWLVAHSLFNNGNAVSFACFVYVASLISLYLASGLSHYFAHDPWRMRFRSLDQACIYLLIVGTYTPFSIAYLNSFWWNSVLTSMWVLAITGFVSKIFFAHRVDRVAIWIYVFLGWIPALAGMPFNHEVPKVCMAWIVAGGAVYTIGTYFLLNDQRTSFHHAIWHLFVLVASAMHFFAIAGFVALK